MDNILALAFIKILDYKCVYSTYKVLQAILSC